MRKKNKTYLLYILPALLFIIIFVYVPIFQNFYFSLFNMNSYTDKWTFVGLSHYLNIVKDPIFYTALKNNTLYAVFSLIFQVGFGLFLAILLDSKFVGKKLKVLFRNIYFLPSLISITAVALMFYFIYNPNIGMLNGFLDMLGLGQWKTAWLANPNTAIYSVIAMSQWQYTGYIMVLLLVAIQKIPKDLYEAAEIDGASEIQKAFYITIPGVKGMLVATSIITVIGSFKLFTEVYVTTGGGPYNTTQVLGTYMYRSAFLFDEMGYGSAVAVIIFIITFTTSLLQIKLSNRNKG